MNILSEFWLSVLETIYMPVYNFFGYNGLLTAIILGLFTAVQVWIWYHLFFKVFVYVCKIFSDFIVKNLLWKDVEVDEK